MGNIKDFHGDLLKKSNPTGWSTSTHKCCRLCKTTCTEGKLAHWAKGLCRSCYRRLSIKHRLYNDNWLNNSKADKKVVSAELKDYKIDKDLVQFKDKDVETLISRYHFSCSYCKVQLQIYDNKRLDSLQVEYRLTEFKEYELVPICKSCNCSKKNLKTEKELQRWAMLRGIDYPFNFISVKI